VTPVTKNHPLPPPPTDLGLCLRRRRSPGVANRYVQRLSVRRWVRAKFRHGRFGRRRLPTILTGGSAASGWRWLVGCRQRSGPGDPQRTVSPSEEAQALLDNSGSVPQNAVVVSAISPHPESPTAGERGEETVLALRARSDMHSDVYFDYQSSRPQQGEPGSGLGAEAIGALHCTPQPPVATRSGGGRFSNRTSSRLCLVAHLGSFSYRPPLALGSTAWSIGGGPSGFASLSPR